MFIRVRKRFPFTAGGGQSSDSSLFSLIISMLITLQVCTTACHTASNNLVERFYLLLKLTLGSIVNLHDPKTLLVVLLGSKTCLKAYIQ